MWESIESVIAPEGDWWRGVVFFAIVLLSLVIGRLARYMMERSTSKSLVQKREWVAAILKAMARPMVLAAFTVGWWLATAVLVPQNNKLAEMLALVSRVLTATAIGFALYRMVDVVDHYLKKLAERTDSKVDDVLAPLVGKSVRVTIAVLILLNIVQVVSGRSVTTILAGLGVGGLAIALAGQDTIKNFFGSVVILGDKPFEIGDRIVVAGHDGSVERVGFRSTKIRTLSGHLVTIPNSEMVNTAVQNIGKRPYIKRVMDITITYDTPPDKAEKAVEIIKSILKDHEGMDPEFPPRVFFSEFKDCSLNIMVLYWYHPPDYWAFMAFSERVNMEILKQFNDEGIEFAFPTQTIWLANGGQVAS